MKDNNKRTGFPALDKLTTGLVNGSLVVIASRPAMGKTGLALNIANHLAKENDQTIVIFSLDMSAEQMAFRLQKAGGTMDAKDGNLRIYDDPVMTVRKMSTICDGIDNLGVVIIDYIQLIHSTEDTFRKESRCIELTQLSRQLKRMAQKMNVPVVCLSQLSRTVEYRVDKRPVLSDFSDSGALVQNADQILFLYRYRYYHPETALGDLTECIVAKNRYGDPGVVKLWWNPESLAFSNKGGAE